MNKLASVITLIGVVASIISIYTFLSGRQSLNDTRVATPGTTILPTTRFGASGGDSNQTYPTDLPPPTAYQQTYPTATATALPTATCPGAPASRLAINMQGRVAMDPYLPNRMRQQAGTNAKYVDSINPGATFVVVDGPECRDKMNWWFIRVLQGTNLKNTSATGLTGWTSEGQGSTYYLVPDPR